MATHALSLATLLVALGAGLVAGVFFAFSSFVLPALARLPGLQGAAAMQSINVVVLNRSFLGTFVGSALGCAGLCLDALLRSAEPGAELRLAAGAFYLVGSLLVTGARNIPWNDKLAALSLDSPDAGSVWASFVQHWSFWNHVRTAASLAAAALLVASSCWG